MAKAKNCDVVAICVKISQNTCKIIHILDFYVTLLNNQKIYDI